MKKLLSAALAFGMTAAVLSSFPVTAVTAPLISSGFESGLDGWEARGSAQVAVSDAASNSGSKSAFVSNRASAWNGIAYSLSGDRFADGPECVFQAYIMQNSTPTPVTFKMTIQYQDGTGTKYDTFASDSIMAGSWLMLSGKYKVPTSGNPVLYFESEDSTVDFYLDDVLVRLADDHGVPEIKLGDIDQNGRIDSDDLHILQKFLLGDSKAEMASSAAADMNKDQKINAKDLTLLKRYLLNPPAETTTVTTVTSTSTSTTTVTTGGGHSSTDPVEYMAQVRNAMTQNVPQNVKSGEKGNVTHFTYYSKKAGHDKGANVWLPPGYSESNQYPVIYMNHGVGGDENGMLSGFSILEMATNMIKSGDAVPFILIFPQMYTDPNAQQGSISQAAMDYYDDFVFDLTESLMPYVKEHWSVKEGRENTAIAGFSMGGRESLYLTILRPDVFGYCAASSPAPGIVPTKDMFLTHLGSYNLERTKRMTNADFKIDKDKLPYLLMIGGGTNDPVVGTYPSEYHQLFTQNGTEHIWMEVQGGGHDGSVGTPLFYNFFRAVFKA